MDFENLKQVTNIEYVGPHQIQTTSMPSVNFSARIESQVATSILYSEQNERIIDNKNNRTN